MPRDDDFFYEDDDLSGESFEGDEPDEYADEDEDEPYVEEPEEPFDPLDYTGIPQMSHLDVPPEMRSAKALFENDLVRGIQLSDSLWERFANSRELDWFETKAVDKALRRACRLYSEFVRSAFKKKHIPIYRLVTVEGVDRVSTDRLGLCWSRYRHTTGNFFGASTEQPDPQTPGKTVVRQRDAVVNRARVMFDAIITAKVQPRHVWWLKSFNQFLDFGEDEWEVTLLPDVPVDVLEIDGGERFGKKTFSPPIKGNSGPLKKALGWADDL